MVFWRPGPNLWFGVRLPWTLADPYIWDKSWRLASRLLMVMGITVLISWRAFWISTVHLVGLSCLYTAILYRWKYGTWRFWKDGRLDRLPPGGALPRLRPFPKAGQPRRPGPGCLRGLWRQSAGTQDGAPDLLAVRG